MVYLPEKFETSSAGLRRSLEPRQSLERGGLWRLDEILPAAVDDLLSCLEGTPAAAGVVEFAFAAGSAGADELPGRWRSPWNAAPMLNGSSLESQESATIGGPVSIF